MSEKTKKIIYWLLTGLVSFVFLGSAFGKLSGNADALKMASDFGIDAKTYMIIGIVELSCLILFVIPRTGVIGTILLASYMGGAIATHLEHNVSIIAPVMVQTFMLVVAFYRFPVLRNTVLSSIK
jgi:DoxX-like family